MKPIEINDFLRRDVIGQEQVLRFVSVAIFKHLEGEPYGNLMLIGNSGTGKTTVMRAMERLYRDHAEFAQYRVVVILNANTFASDEGVIDTARMFVRLEERARQILGENATAEQIGQLMEHATVCLDEIDKVSGVVGGKPYVTGLNIQQALLTLIEGERVDHTVVLRKNGKETHTVVHLNTAKMLFLCAGAFEALYEQVFHRVTSPTSRVKLPTETVIIDGEVHIREYFSLGHHFKQEDLFDYGMQPQFLSRFDNTIILEELTPELLKQILLGPDDSVFNISRRFFRRHGIDLDITDDAAGRIAFAAAEARRIGARALKEVYGRIIKPFEFDPTGQTEPIPGSDRRRLVIDEDLVARSLRQAVQV
jgi:ATP-dependent Clp protease ATP-binding subunit ClpX